MMGVGTNPHSPRILEDGDETRTAAAKVAATAVVVGVPAPVSHPRGLEASPSRCASGRSKPRWDLQPLVMIVLAMTWAAGDSQPEKFETARGFYVAAHEARKRPGKTIQGFQKALSRLPLRPLQALAAGVRDQIRLHYAQRLLIDGFEPMGCDGSRIECPRSAELEARLPPSGKDDSAPTIWVTAFVHLGTGLLWSWRLGLGTADERPHLRQLLVTLSPRALIVADAAYMGYELARAIVLSRRSFLLRMSSKIHLYTVERAELTSWSRRAGLLLAGLRSRSGPAADPLPADPRAGPRQGQARCLAVDRHSGPVAAVGEDCREILPLEMAK